MKSFLLVPLSLFIASIPAFAEFKEARVTQIIQDVKILPGQEEPRPAVVNDPVGEGTAVRTGVQSRTELTFADLTIARLGANTIFSFDKGERAVDLGSGAVLLRVPKNSGGAKINTAAVTAAITGTTVIAEYNCPRAIRGEKATCPDALFKFIALEGSMRICKNGVAGECVDLGPGQMLVGTADKPFSVPVDVDLERLLETSLLIQGFPPLPSEDLMFASAKNQLEQKSEGQLTRGSGNVYNVQDVTNVIDQRIAASPTPAPTPSASPSPSVSPTPVPTPVPTPSKFGTPPVITSPNLLVIDGNTVLQTDPSITRNGETDYGRIYRGPVQDGSPSNYYFGSTSAFDTSSGVNQIFGSASYIPFATFKFTSLVLAGNPTISTANGGATSLALIGVNGISTAAPGGTLTFAGINTLLLATQSGAITLTNHVSFSNLNNFFLYARGSGSNLTIGSSINGISGALIADAEGNVDIENNITTGSFISAAGVNFGVGSGNVRANIIQISAGNNLNFALNNFAVGTNSVAQVRLDAGNAVNIDATGDQSVFNNAHNVNVIGNTINLTGNNPTTFNFAFGTPVNFTAGAGGIVGPTVGFRGANLTLLSGGNISIYSTFTYRDQFENLVLEGSITALNGSFTSVANVVTGTFHVGQNITIGGRLDAGSITSDNGTINATNGIKASGGSIFAGGNIVTNGALELGQMPNGTFGNITANGNIVASGGIFTPGDPVTVSAGGDITTPGLITGMLRAGGNIFINNASGSLSGIGVIANGIYASGGQGMFYAGTLNLDNVPSIKPNNGSSVNHDGETLTDFTLQVGRIVSAGAARAILSSNGGNANPNFNDSNPGNGGNIFVGINVGDLAIGSGADLDSIVANGGAFNASGPFGGGNGGSILSGVTGNVTIGNASDGSPGISAVTGSFPNPTSQFGGAGGRVAITAGGTIRVNGTVQVASDDARIIGPSANRESASGGSITLQSNRTTGSGITVAQTGQLLSLLGINAPGPAGAIRLSTMGANIVVNGIVRADFGTITLDQNDPAGMIPTITLDGATLQAATLNINGSGDLLIGPNNSTAINIFGGTWNVARDITLDAANTTFAYSFALNATAGRAINFTGGNADVSATLTLPLSGNTTFTAGIGGIDARFTDIHYSGAELNLMSGGDITAHSITFTDFFARGNVNAAGAIFTTGNLWEGNITAGTTINVGGSILAGAVTAGTTITAGPFISARSLTAGGDITADNTHVQFVTSPNGVLRVASLISPYVFSTDPMFLEQGAAAPHTYTVDSIVSPRIDFSGNQFNGILGYTFGGLLTINANSLTFDASTGIGSANFNGADVNGFSGGTTPTIPGDGGKLTVNATGDITVNAPITASTGLTNLNSDIGGVGGTVTLNSTSGTVSTSSTIQVSHADPTPGRVRRSAAGGKINITSGHAALANGPTGRPVAINIGSSSQLLALLDASATGPGGKITILATGANTDVNVNGRSEATRGTIDVRHQGNGGHINIGSAGSTTMSADVIKAGAFGSNGQLNIGNSTLNADSLIRLYATGSNGELNFVANTTLSSGTRIDLAANTITIQPSVIVTISGNGGAANVYTNNPNYSGPGGINPANGSFGGNGANLPQPLNNAPPFGNPPPVPPSHGGTR